MPENELRGLEHVVRQLNDIEEIKQLKARYFRCVDAQDWNSWATHVLTEDFHFESAGGVQDGSDEVVAAISKSLEGGKTIHHGHTPVITITGPDTATGTWAMNSYVMLPGEDASSSVMRRYGYYHEEYRRTEHGWRIRSSKIVTVHVDVEAAA